jgi:hypothetical protein
MKDIIKWYVSVYIYIRPFKSKYREEETETCVYISRYTDEITSLFSLLTTVIRWLGQVWFEQHFYQIQAPNRHKLIHGHNRREGINTA